MSKTTVEDSISLAKSETKEINLLPSISQTIVIKYLASKNNKAEEGIKIKIKDDKKDDKTIFSLAHDGKRLTKILDIMEGTRVRGTQISPNGDFVLINYRNVIEEGAISLYTELYNTQTGQDINLGNITTYWMPKTNAYYQVVKRENKNILTATDPSTMKETVLTDMLPSDNSSFSFTPDEKSLIYQEKESYDERKGDLRAIAAPNDRQANYYDRYYLHKFDISTGLRTQLTFGKESTYLNDISEDSRYILFSVNNETITKRPFRVNSTYKLDLQTLELETIWENEAFIYSGKFSPNGKELLITATPEAFNSLGANVIEGKGDLVGQIPNTYDIQAFTMDLETKNPKAITQKFNPSIKSMYWNKHDKLIYMLVIDKDYERLYSYNPKSEKFNLINLQEDVIASISLAENVNKASYYGQSLMNSAKAYTLDLSNNKSTEISNPTKDLFAQLRLGEVKDWSFKASDGTMIDGRYYLPPKFDSSKKYPMIVYYYGGTTPSSRTFEHPYSMHVYAAQGYVVYVINPSGTIGWGQEFSARHVNAWGKRTAEDIIEGTEKFTADHSFVNKDKIGCIGASYGGFMTMYLQTRTNLFAAAISHAGISSLSSYWGEGYWGYSYSGGASANSYPWNNKELYIEQSPLFAADKVNTPILFLHGEEDTNVPIGESIQMYTALKILGKTAELVQVKGENHGIMKYERRLDWNYSIYSWFDRWLKDDSAWWDALYPHRKDK